MLEVVEIIKQLENENSTNRKIEILKENKNNELLKMILEYTYNPFKKYKVTEKTIVAVTKYFPSKWNDIFEVLDELSTSNINDKLRRELGYFLSSIKNEEEYKLYLKMLLKDLKCNISSKTINKVWKGLIPEFNVMLAENYFKQKEDYLEGKEFILTTKLDGIRAVIIKEGNDIKIYSRQGQLIEGLTDIESEVSKIKEDLVLDGELLLKNDNNLPSDELYRETMKVVRKDGLKRNVEFYAFDIISKVEEFKSGIHKVKCSSRKVILNELCQKYNFKNIKNVEILYQGKDEFNIIELLNVAKANNQEGIILNLSDAPYECKRSKGILKVKVFSDGDMRCVDVIEGTGKNKGKLGSITIEFEHDEKIHRCDCGSGFKDSERELYWKHPELILNKIVTIGYFEISENKQGGVGLRFPTWKGIIRNDKDEISMN